MFLLLAGCEDEIVSFTGQTMGTTYQVKIADKVTISQDNIDQRLAQINAIFSTWQHDSEITHINNAPINQWLDVSTELFYVLQTAQLINQQSGGYFDITMGHLSTAWGFQGEGNSRAKPVLADEVNTVVFGQQYLRLADNRIKKLANIKLDVSAIAKGYGVDALAHLLKQTGHHNFLVEIGGEIKIQGNKLNGQKWTVAIETPNQTNTHRITLNNEAVATSGDYRNYYTANNKQYSHILNPQHAAPADNSMVSISVVHADAMLADAYATALIAMPYERALIWAKQQQLKAFFIVDNQDSLTAFWITQ